MSTGDLCCSWSCRPASACAQSYSNATGLTLLFPSHLPAGRQGSLILASGENSWDFTPWSLQGIWGGQDLTSVSLTCSHADSNSKSGSCSFFYATTLFPSTMCFPHKLGGFRLPFLLQALGNPFGCVVPKHGSGKPVSSSVWWWLATSASSGLVCFVLGLPSSSSLGSRSLWKLFVHRTFILQEEEGSTP